MAVERVEIENEGSPWKEEHLSRYYHVRDLGRDKVILDIACGTGFGSELFLANGAASVHAADVSDEAIATCSKRLAKYDTAKWTCHKQDGTHMTYAADSFDMVASFETIEHIPDYDAFLSEIHRVLKPGGVLVLSTPNGLVTNPDKGIPKNPFHVYEFPPDELKRALEKYFAIELAAGQHIKPNYGVAPFLPSFNSRKLNLKGKINFTYWRLLLRLPSSIRDGLHHLFFGSAFYPRVEEYTFKEENLEKAHVQYYICRKMK